METRSTTERQYMRCGYEPPIDIPRVHLTIWQPPTGNERCGYKGPDLTICAGYTANLPEVTEAALARAVAKYHALGFVSEGSAPTEDLLNAILVLDAEYGAVENWLMTPSKDGGGGS